MMVISMEGKEPFPDLPNDGPDMNYRRSHGESVGAQSFVNRSKNQPPFSIFQVK